MPDLSIIVLSWNTRDLTAACLEAIAQARGAGSGLNTPSTLSIETILVDNGSADGTTDLVRARFPWVELIALPGNLGFAAGNNVGLRRARGRFALLLNSDTRIDRHAIEYGVSFLQRNPTVGAAGVQLVHPDGRLQNSIHNFPSLTTEVVPKWLLELARPRRFPSKRFRHPGPVDVEAVLGACLFVRREAWERIGLLPEDYFLFLEETDWCWSMREAGFRVVHLPEVRLVHHSGASSKKKVPAATRIEYHRALYRFLRKRRGALQTRLVLGLRAMKALVAVLVRIPAALVSQRGRERLHERWQVLAWHLRGRPETEGLVTRAYLEHIAAQASPLKETQ
jgi:GT2 family glycosyltransferase